MPLPLLPLAAGFFSKSGTKLALIAGGVVAVVAVVGIVYGRGYSSGKDSQRVVLERERAAWAEERAKASDVTAAMERRYRSLERAAQEEIDSLKKDRDETIAAYASRNSALDESRASLLARNRLLLDHVGRLAKAGGSGDDARAARESLQQSIEATVILVDRIDQLADRCAREADELRDDVADWRRYGEAVKRFNSKLKGATDAK